MASSSLPILAAPFCLPYAGVCIALSADLPASSQRDGREGPDASGTPGRSWSLVQASSMSGDAHP